MGGWREKGRRPKRARTRPAQDSPQDRAQDFGSPSLEPGPRAKPTVAQRTPSAHPAHQITKIQPFAQDPAQDLSYKTYKISVQDPAQDLKRPPAQDPSESCAHKAGLVRTRFFCSVTYSNMISIVHGWVEYGFVHSYTSVVSALHPLVPVTMYR